MVLDFLNASNVFRSLSRLIHLGVGVPPTMVAKAKMALDGLSTSLQVFPETRPMFSQWLSVTQNLDKVLTLII